MAKNSPPKGKVKGGTRFPKHDLASCFPWAEKLVSKTHNGAQKKDLILAGVVETKGPHGEVKIAALKQFGLIEGDTNAYLASDLAKNMVNAPPEEREPLLHKAALIPPVFKGVFDTFKGDTVSTAKLRQRFTDLKVHPDSAAKGVEIYTASLAYAGLGSLSGEQFSHITDDVISSLEDQEDSTSCKDNEKKSSEKHINDEYEASNLTREYGRAVIHVNVTVDSSLDTDKLEKQLKLLRKYGAL